MRAIPHPHPGIILREEFLLPLGISNYRLAKEIGVPQTRVGEIVAGRRSLSADTALRLAKYFNTSELFWMNLQLGHDAALARDQLREVLAAIRPHASAA
jgi:addiction module HigA family antidote